MNGKSTNHRHPQSTTTGPAVRAVQVGVIADVCFTALKLAGGWVFRSSSLVADGWHSASDLATDLVALVVVWTSHHLRTMRQDTSGARLLEDASSFVSSGALVALGLQMAWDHMTALQLHVFGASSGHDSQTHMVSEHGSGPSSPNPHAVWIAIVTVIAKEWLYHRTLKVAKNENSALLESTAMHHRLDGLMSFVTIASVLLSASGNGTAWADSLGGLCISIILTQGAFRNLGSACGWLAK